MMSRGTDTQLPLLDWRPPVASPRASEQDRQLARVEGRIARYVLGWLRARLDGGDPEFHLGELVEAVECQIEGSPDSASRVLRSLRRAGHADVELLSRSGSLYRVRAVRP